MDGYYWTLRVGKKYDPSQPRVPAGNPEGGQWTAAGGTSFAEAARRGESVSTSELGGGVCHAVRVEYKDDGSGVWKGLWEVGGWHDGNSEVAAYRLSEALGFHVVPETVYAQYEGEDGTSQLFIEDADLGAWRSVREIPDETKEQIIALDIIMYNADRHNGNWVFDTDDRVWAIDHGHAQWQIFRDSNMAPMWRSQLFGPGRQATGTFQFSEALMEKLRNVTLDDFYAAFDGVDQSRNVDMYAAVDNLQYILEQDGRIEW
jgi:hypothetical protein